MANNPSWRADHAMVALLRFFFDLIEMLVEFLLVEESGAIDALEFVAADIGRAQWDWATDMILNAF